MSIFEEAVRVTKPLKIGLCGPAGSGKTYSALLLARGIVGPEGQIAVADTEAKSSALYSGLTPFKRADIEHPFTIQKFLDVINAAVDEGFDCLIIDTVTPFWKWLLTEHNRLTGRSGNSFQEWGKITPIYESFVDTFIRAPIHIIVTSRAKVKYEVDMSSGKMQVRRIGIGWDFRAGFEYEADVLLDMIAQGRNNIAIVVKTRYTVLPTGEEFTPTVEHGKLLIDWVKSGNEPTGKPPFPLPREAPKNYIDDENNQTEEKELW